MREVAAGPYKDYLRMRSIHRTAKLDSIRMGAIFLVIKTLLRLLGCKRDFIGLSIYLEAVGTTNIHRTDMPEDNQFAMKIWFKDWP